MKHVKVEHKKIIAEKQKWNEKGKTLKVKKYGNNKQTTGKKKETKILFWSTACLRR